MEERLTPIKAIKQKCLECSAFDRGEVRNCLIKDCPLYPYRLGKNPYIKRELSDVQRKEVAQRLRSGKALSDAKEDD